MTICHRVNEVGAKGYLPVIVALNSILLLCFSFTFFLSYFLFTIISPGRRLLKFEEEMKDANENNTADAQDDQDDAGEIDLRSMCTFIPSFPILSFDTYKSKQPKRTLC